MTQQTISVGRNPQVIISQVDASLSVRASQEQIISVETAASSVALFTEGDKLIITNCQGDLALRVPALKTSNISITTDITAIHLSGNVTIEGAGQVKLKEIGGNVILKDIAGDTELENIHGTADLTDMWGGLRAVGMPSLFARQGIKGDVLLSHIALVEIDAIGGNLVVDKAGKVEVLAVGGDLEVAGIEEALLCTTVGADCRVQHSTNAQIIISNVADNFQMVGVISSHMSVIGEDLDLQPIFPIGCVTRFHVGGNATLTLPDDVSLNLSAMVGGQMSVEALGYGGGGNFVNFLYGDGAARLELLVDGDLLLLGAAPVRRL
jgi:hypothetical protein